MHLFRDKFTENIIVLISKQSFLDGEYDICLGQISFLHMGG